MKKCLNLRCVFYGITILSNVAMIIGFLWLFTETRGDRAIFILLLAMPSILSIIALTCRTDKEERDLKKRIKKAHLRKELAELKDFDTAD